LENNGFEPIWQEGVAFGSGSGLLDGVARAEQSGV